jgi:hypothetical protein
MLDVLEVQDKLKNFSQEQLLREMQMPTGSVPQFLVLSELNRRRTMSQDMEKQKMADQPTVKEEVVAASGMPMPETSMLAQQMAPQTSMSENTGIAAMMPKELPSEEEPMKMSFGGLLMGSRMLNQMAAPLAKDVMDRRQVTDMRYRPDTNQPQIARRGYSGGLGGLGSDIMSRVSDKSRGDVDNFLGEVEGMAEERFDIDLAPQQRQIGIGGKGQLTRRAMPAMPFAMNEGGPIKAQGGMFADISGAIGSADAPSFSMPPAFASIYNYAKTVLGLDDELARDVANKTIEQGNIDKSQLGMFSAKPFGSVEERLSGDDRLAQRKALDTFTGGAEMNRLVDQLSKPTTDIGGVQDVQDIDPLRLDIQNRLAESKKPKTANMFRGLGGEYDAINQKLQEAKDVSQALDNFSGGAEMSDLVNQLGKSQKVLPENPYADDIKKMTDMGVGSGVASMDRGFKAVGDYLMEDKFADVRQAEKEKKIQDAFTFGRGSPLSGMMADRPQTLGVTADQSSIFERDQKEEAERTKKAFENFTGGEEMDKLVDKMQTDKTKKTDSDSAGALGGFGATSGALSELEAEIDKLRAKREKGRESDKWFALAEVGLGMLASQSPTLAGALGEGGLRGLKSFREGKKEYDKDMLGYLTTKASIQKTRGELGLKSQLYKKQIEALKNKGKTGGVTAKELLASRDRQLARRGDLLKDLNIAADYTEFLESGGKTPASSTVLELLRLDENIKNLEKQLGSGFATVDLNTVN